MFLVHICVSSFPANFYILPSRLSIAKVISSLSKMKSSIFNYIEFMVLETMMKRKTTMKRDMVMKVAMLVMSVGLVKVSPPGA